MSIVVVIVVKHHEYALVFLHKEGRRTMRDLLKRAGHGVADSANAFQLRFGCLRAALDSLRLVALGNFLRTDLYDAFDQLHRNRFGQRCPRS